MRRQILNLLSRRLEVVSTRKIGLTRGRHARRERERELPLPSSVSLSRKFFLAPTTSKRQLRILANSPYYYHKEMYGQNAYTECFFDEIECKNNRKILTPSSTGLSHKGPVPEYQDGRQSFPQNQLRVHPKMVWKDFLPEVMKGKVWSQLLMFLLWICAG